MGAWHGYWSPRRSPRLASGGYGRTPEAQTLPGQDRDGGQFSVGADVAYEVDLFGRVSSGIAAARGDVAAARADAEAVRVMVVADTTRAYADAASAAARSGASCAKAPPA